jgi:hypothetical protein
VARRAERSESSAAFLIQIDRICLRSELRWGYRRKGNERKLNRADSVPLVRLRLLVRLDFAAKVRTISERELTPGLPDDAPIEQIRFSQPAYEISWT